MESQYIFQRIEKKYHLTQEKKDAFLDAVGDRIHRLRLEDDSGCVLLDPDLYLMEIKVPSAYPLWLVEILSDLKIYPSSFSKYGSVYENNF